MKKILVLDIESTIKANGHPFHTDNRMCFAGLLSDSGSMLYDIEYSSNPYAEQLKEIKRKIEEADLLIGFNIKFDLHWIRRYINDISFPAVWDCQLAEFILAKQASPYPALGETCSRGSPNETLCSSRAGGVLTGIEAPLALSDLGQSQRRT